MTLSDRQTRINLARLSIEGLSVGDAFGQCFFASAAKVNEMIAQKILPPTPWLYTDDTVMALGIEKVLDQEAEIEQDTLAEIFANNYLQEPDRGYGGTAHQILRNIANGIPWKIASSNVFDGMGSIGNGGAMRAAPIGAYFYDDFDKVTHQAAKSAAITHSHPEGQAGAIAVAIAAAYAHSINGNIKPSSGQELLDLVKQYTPDSDTCSKLNKALALPFSYSIQTAVSALGNGAKLTAPDTVPFALWCAARHLDNFEAALWATVSGLGDRDTTCAIVGSIVVLANRLLPIPPEWLQRREPLPWSN